MCTIYKQTDDGLFKIDESTGESTSVSIIERQKGDKYFSPRQVEQYRRKKELEQEYEQKKRMQKAQRSELGSFYFVDRNHNFSTISEASLTKLMFLLTFLQINSNKLMLTQRKQMQFNDLYDVLQIKKSSLYDFWNEVHPQYIQNTDEGLCVTTQAIRCGSLHGQISMQKFYKKGIQKLYKACPASQHRHLSYVLRLLPYINIEYNIICHNPDEKDCNEIKPLTLQEFCDMIGYSYSHICRLKAAFKAIRFPVKSHTERFISIVNDESMYVNPHITYNGHDYKRVEILGAFCK